MDRMLLSGMTFFGRHGALAAERELGARFTVDVEIGLARDVDAASDRLQDALDYTSVYRAVQAHIEGPSVALLETLAARMAADLLARPLAQEVTVRVHKRPPVEGEFRDFAVEVTRRR